MTWTIGFHTEARAEIDGWPIELQAALVRIFDRIETLGLERIREPMLKHLEGGLWEMRPSGKHIEGRALYVTLKGRRVVVVLGFLKKTQKTPRRLIELALQRAEEVE